MDKGCLTCKHNNNTVDDVPCLGCNWFSHWEVDDKIILTEIQRLFCAQSDMLTELIQKQKNLYDLVDNCMELMQKHLLKEINGGIKELAFEVECTKRKDEE